MNVGEAAGQTIFHLHVHLIPRYAGDVPTRAAASVTSSRARATTLTGAREPRPSHDAPPGHRRRGRPSPLPQRASPRRPSRHRRRLRPCRAASTSSGGAPPRLPDRRKGRLRVLTGDYLGLPTPTRLTRLLDLETSHGDAVEPRVFETKRVTPERRPAPPPSFHPKTYIFRGSKRRGCGLRRQLQPERLALTGRHRVELPRRLVTEGTPLPRSIAAFERLFTHPAPVRSTADWIDAYRARRVLKVLPTADARAVRRSSRALVTAADAACDSAGSPRRAGAARESGATPPASSSWPPASARPGSAPSTRTAPSSRRILFVAHREEILRPGAAHVPAHPPHARLGLLHGRGEGSHAPTSSSPRSRPSAESHHLEQFRHATTSTTSSSTSSTTPRPRTYRSLIDHFKPAFLLGLTATPERTRRRRPAGPLRREPGLPLRPGRGPAADSLLCRFEYFGVPDEVDYTNIPWRSTSSTRRN